MLYHFCASLSDVLSNPRVIACFHVSFASYDRTLLRDAQKWCNIKNGLYIYFMFFNRISSWVLVQWFSSPVQGPSGQSGQSGPSGQSGQSAGMGSRDKSLWVLSSHWTWDGLFLSDESSSVTRYSSQTSHCSASVLNQPQILYSLLWSSNDHTCMPISVPVLCHVEVSRARFPVNSATRGQWPWYHVQLARAWCQLSEGSHPKE